MKAGMVQSLGLRKPIVAIAAVAALALLGACSAIKLTYNNADVLARFRASDYVDFTPAQAEQFKARFAALHRWHRAQELPAYVQLLNTGGDKIGRGLTSEDAAWAIANARTRYRKLAARAAMEAAPILVTLTPAQLQQMEKKFAENNRKYARDYLDGDARRLHYKRALQIEDYFKDWIGNLNDAQIERIDRFADIYGRMQALRLEDRQRTQQDALELLRSESSAARLGPRLGALFEHPEEGRPVEFRTAMARYESDIASLVLDMDRLLTPDQRQRAQRRARSYAEDLAALSGASPVAAAALLLTAL